MTHITEDAKEADDMGEKPDLGRHADALHEALSGSDMGSDTRAGSLRGGSASGSEIDPDQDQINETLATEGMAAAQVQPNPPQTQPQTEAVNNTGEDRDPDGDDVDAATG